MGAATLQLRVLLHRPLRREHDERVVTSSRTHTRHQRWWMSAIISPPFSNTSVTTTRGGKHRFNTPTPVHLPPQPPTPDQHQTPDVNRTGNPLASPLPLSRYPQPLSHFTTLSLSFSSRCRACCCLSLSFFYFSLSLLSSSSSLCC